MTAVDAARRRRCRALQLAVFFGVLLPVFTRTWITLAVGLTGAAVAVVTYWRNCRGRGPGGDAEEPSGPTL